ncbi:hypothetical protein SAMN04489712_10547 [Thermomonospora echinospora]|uniref:DUF2218 domain-containing protein n=1 Tax=Thermomonospora echinospora TaxID=1992 RepID=A0A1H5ZW44_9ACTN|nr:DUF2218 domain-containing protein [Thermomonospora echinospora]SEG40718.1 hypothetical protein SAMN04489712_10547 [Thermomonospora echinospora]
MIESTARVTTDRPARYIKQLCDHLGRRVTTTVEGDTGHVALPEGAGACDLRAEDGVLVMTATAPDAEGLARVEDVVGRHLERFGTRESLTVSWIRTTAEGE